MSGGRPLAICHRLVAAEAAGIARLTAQRVLQLAAWGHVALGLALSRIFACLRLGQCAAQFGHAFAQRLQRLGLAVERACDIVVFQPPLGLFHGAACAVELAQRFITGIGTCTGQAALLVFEQATQCLLAFGQAHPFAIFAAFTLALGLAVFALALPVLLTLLLAGLLTLLLALLLTLLRAAWV